MTNFWTEQVCLPKCVGSQDRISMDSLTFQSLHCCCQDLSISEVKVIVKDADVKDGVPLSLVSDSASDAQQTTATCLNLAVSWCFLKGRVKFGGERMMSRYSSSPVRIPGTQDHRIWESHFKRARNDIKFIKDIHREPMTDGG